MWPKSIEILESNYSKFTHQVVHCRLQNLCKIVNENRVAHCLSVYLNNVANQEKSNETKVSSLEKLLQEASEKKSCESSENLSDNTQSKISSFALSQYSANCQNQNEVEFKLTNTNTFLIERSINDTISTQVQDDDHKRNTSQNNKSKLNEFPQNGERISRLGTSNKHHCLSSPDRPHQCTICDMAFKRKLHLKRHFLVVHTKKKNHVCKICGKSFSRKDYLDKHAAGHLKRNLKLRLLREGVVVRTKLHLKVNNTAANKLSKI